MTRQVDVLERLVGQVRAAWKSAFGGELPADLRAVALRDISLMDVVDQVYAEITARDPEDPNHWHWLKDLYVDDEKLYAVTVSAGRLYRWPVTVSGSHVTVGNPVAVEIEFAPVNASAFAAQMVVKRTETGAYWGYGVLCTATLNKKGILDSRGLFDAFVTKFQGDGREYINVMHIDGSASRIGELRQIGRDDKTLWGIYKFDEDPVAMAAARTLANDTEGYWGGSIEFDLDGPIAWIEVVEGIRLPVTTDGTLLGYSIARNQDCAAWYTGGGVAQREIQQARRVNMAMSSREREIALELLGDAELVEALEQRLHNTNQALADAVTYTMRSAGTSSEGVGHDVANGAGEEEAEEEAEREDGNRQRQRQAADASTHSTSQQVARSGTAGSPTDGSTGSATESGVLRVVTVQQFRELSEQVAGLGQQVAGLVARASQVENRVAALSGPPELEIDAEVIDQVRGLVLASAEMQDFVQQLVGLRGDLVRQSSEWQDALHARVAEIHGRFEGLEARTATTEERLDGRVAALEQDEERRWQEHEAAKPAQPGVKVSVRPRQHNREAGAGQESGKGLANGVLSGESSFVQRARAQRVGGK
ncbi:MAG: hypothetical protein H6641_16260 [Caldilineaceae bacterium]|nr:hypothetical protein [Caldilineaceae bacterium]